MPKVNADSQLLENVKKIIALEGGCSAAARALGVNRTTLWRFKADGHAIARTRTKLTNAIKVHQSESNEVVRKKFDQGGGPVTISRDKLKEMRDMSRRLTQLVDMLEVLEGDLLSPGSMQIGQKSSTAELPGARNGGI